MSYRDASQWDDKNEILCLIIFKQLQSEGFPRGKQMDYCRIVSEVVKLEPSNLSAKVSNYKSVAGINKASHASKNTIYLFDKYKDYTIQELKKIIDVAVYLR